MRPFDVINFFAVAANAGRVLARVVLLGDPLQLRGVVHSKMAENMGYGKINVDFFFIGIHR